MQQNVRARYDYDPYGRITKIQGDKDTVFGYTGHFWHGPSGLNLTYFRAYDPGLGRWISRDPIEEWGGLNLYAYVEGNVTRLIDPLGLDGTLSIWAARPLQMTGPQSVLNVFQHSGTIFYTPGGPVFVSSGPTNPDGTGQNRADISYGPGAISEFNSFKDVISSDWLNGDFSIDDLKNLVDEWNKMNIPYNPKNSNCNTFQDWLRDRLKLPRRKPGWRRPGIP